MPPIDFIEETDAPAIDFIADPDPTPAEPAAAPPPQSNQPAAFDYGMVNAQQRLAELPQEAREQLQTPLVTLPELVSPDIAVASRLGVPGAQAVESVAAAAGRPIKSLVEGMTSPLGLAALAVAPAAPELMVPLMTVPAIPAVPEYARQTVEGIREGNLPKTVEGGVGTLLNTALIAAPVVGGVRGARRAQEAEVARLGKETRNVEMPPEAPPGAKIDFVPEEVAAPETTAPPAEPIGMGGAVPSEFKPAESTTGIKNATVEQERAARGLPPAIEPAKRSFGTVWDDAMAKIDADPRIPEDLVSSLKKNPRSLTDTEDAILLHRQIDLQNEYGKATRDLAQAVDDGRLADAEIQKARIGTLSDQLLELYDVGKSAGTETGRGLAARKMMADEDFTLARMETDYRAAKGGKPLTDAERTELTAKAAEFQKLSQELEAKVAERDRLLADEKVARATAEMAAEKATIPEHIRNIVDRIGQILDTRADAARKRLQGKLFSVSPDVLKDLAEIGASNIYHIGVDFAKWSAKMIEDIGERVRPHLNEIWEASKKLIDDVTDLSAGAGKENKERVTKAVREAETPQLAIERLTKDIRDKSAEEGADLGPLIQKLARQLVASGVRDRDVLVDSVHDIVGPLVEGWTRRNTMDAISGYGTVKLLKKDEVSVRLRDLKGQLQQIGKLEDMAAGEAPQKTGLERRTPSDTERELIRLVNQAKREGGYTTRNPETELKTALATVKTRMRNEISDLERRLKVGDFSKKTRREIELDEEALTLEHKRDALKSEWRIKLAEKQLAEQSAPQKAYRYTQETFNLWRALRTSLDFSALLNQGKFLVLTHPSRTLGRAPAMIRSFFSDKEAFRANQDILKRDNYPLYRRSGLFLSEHGGKLSKMEEVYASRLADKIPGVAQSSRAYSTFLNLVRADAFDALAATLGRDGTLTLPEARVLANFINVATGRGSIGVRDNVGQGLNTFFFAPRFVASRFQMLLGQPIYHGVLSGKAGWNEAARARKLVAQEYGRLLGGYGVLFGLATLAGLDFETDPRSSDFLKFRLGETRIDPLAGLSQATVIIAKTLAREKKTIKGNVVPLTGKVPHGGQGLGDVWATFLRTKLAPVWSTTADFLTGKDVTGKPVSTEPLDLFLNYIGPITFADIMDTMEEQGVPKGVILTMLSLFGERIQTFDKETRK